MKGMISTNVTQPEDFQDFEGFVDISKSYLFALRSNSGRNRSIPTLENPTAQHLHLFDLLVQWLMEILEM